MFDKDFFRKHQRTLLWLLNTPVIRILFRKIMCIEQDVKIDRIDPNGTFWIQEDGKIGFDIRTHNKYSKRLYYGFYYLWAIAHFLDMNFINFFVPKWNLGFDSFGPIYPDAGTGNTTVDGMVRRSGVDETFSNILAGAGTSAFPSTTASGLRLGCSTTTNQYAELRENFYGFDTSAIGSGAIIDSAIFSIVSSAKSNTIGTPSIHIASSSPANNNNLASSDYRSVGSTSFSEVAYASIVSDSSTYNDFTLNSSGESHINTTGVTNFSAQLSWEILASTTGVTWTSGQYSDVNILHADSTGTSQDPKLTGTFTAPVTYNSGFLMFF